MKKITLFLALIFLTSVFAFTGCINSKNTATHYDIEVTFADNILNGKQTLTYYNDTETALTELKFNLFANAFRKDAKFSPVGAQHTAQSYYNGVSYGDMAINAVKSGNQDVEFSVGGQDMNILTVKLGTEVYPEESVQVFIDFTVTLANVVARTGINKNTINLANFYPILCARDDNGFYECVYYSTGDPFYSDCANYKVTFTGNENLIVASSGKTVSVEDEGGLKTHVFEIENARSFALVLSEKFETISYDCDGVEVLYYYYEDKNPQNSLDYAKKSLTYFENTFGEYPYSTYSVVQTEFVQGGMEFPALVMISDDLEQSAYGEVIVHETAHQWWQTAVGNNEIEYGFLDEGLAEYSVVLFYENYPEYNLTRKALVQSAEQTYKVFCSVSDKLFGKVNTVMLRSLKDFSSEYEYVNMAYIKPCIMYDTLRNTVGEEKFFKALKRYYESYKFKNATPDDLVGVYEKIGADSNGFFKSFFNGTVII